MSQAKKKAQAAAKKAAQASEEPAAAEPAPAAAALAEKEDDEEEGEAGASKSAKKKKKKKAKKEEEAPAPTPAAPSGKKKTTGISALRAMMEEKKRLEEEARKREEEERKRIEEEERKAEEEARKKEEEKQRRKEKEKVYLPHYLPDRASHDCCRPSASRQRRRDAYLPRSRSKSSVWPSCVNRLYWLPACRSRACSSKARRLNGLFMTTRRKRKAPQANKPVAVHQPGSLRLCGKRSLLRQNLSPHLSRRKNKNRRKTSNPIGMLAAATMRNLLPTTSRTLGTQIVTRRRQSPQRQRRQHPQVYFLDIAYMFLADSVP